MATYENIDDAIENMNVIGDEFTPKSLAWKLLTDDVIQSDSTDMLLSSPEGNVHSYVFEILLNIYIEMILALNKLIHFHKQNENDEQLSEKNFKLCFKDITYEHIMNPYKSDFLKMGYCLHVDPLETLHDDTKKYYCRIMFKDEPSSKSFFTMNNNIKSHYHFLGNSKQINFEYTKLKNVYAITTINDTTYKIYFTKTKDEIINTKPVVL